MKVLQVIGGLGFGGIQSMVLSIFRNIDKNKIMFDFVCFPGQEKYEMYDEIVSLGATVYVCPQYDMKNQMGFLRWWTDFFNKHKEYKIVHGHLRGSAFIYVPIAKRDGSITIVHSHSTSNGNGMQAAIKNLLQLPIRFQADYLFACSDEAGKWLFGKHVIDKENFKIVKNGINGKRFSFKREVRKQIREEMKLGNSFVLGHVGRFIKAKNQLFILDVFNELKIRGVDCKLLFVGGGDLENEAKVKTQKYGLEKDVVFIGRKGNTEDYYQAMDVFVFPSLWEGLGMVAVEAQASGLPCFVSERIPSIVDIGAGLFFQLNLDAGVSQWADRILEKRDYIRKEQIQFLRRAGYDAITIAQDMEKFYLNLDKDVYL